MRSPVVEEKRLGVWFFGALGSIALHTMVGARAVARGLRPTTGLVTELPPLAGLGLRPLSHMVFGGHELREGDPVVAARALCGPQSGLDPALVEAVAEDLSAVAGDLRAGCRAGLGPWSEGLEVERGGASPSAVDEVERMRGDLESFRRRHGLERVVAVNVCSTEPVDSALLENGHDLEEVLRRQDTPPSVLFTIAALQAGCPVVNFTPSPGLQLPAVRELADAGGLPVCGQDGKTGETLLKTVLAPMFLWRHLRVLSWESYNLLGNRDGRILDGAESKESKLAGKSGVLREIYDYPFHGDVHIDYVPSLDDQKTAWDLVHFEGFLGARMTLQFTWQGFDSILAAPLVLDLARIVDRSHADGRVGSLPYTSVFFKAPLEAPAKDFAGQMRALLEWAEEQKRAD